MDDGLIELRVQKVEGHEIHCEVENGGPLSSNKSINIPDVHILLPSLTDKDREDLKFAVDNDFDFIAASFVRKASDVENIRAELRKHGGDNIRIIAKIENREGVENLEGIIAASDGIMVARGDLGVEIPAHEVPILQKKMIKATIRAGLPVITATQMLDSMIRNPRPTRAEVSDVANAVFDGTSCVMLSGGTASVTAKDLNASAILAATRSGYTAKVISRFRPACPIVALCQNESTRRQLAISWGVHPYLSGEVDSTDRMFSLAVDVARKGNAVRVRPQSERRYGGDYRRRTPGPVRHNQPDQGPDCGGRPVKTCKKERITRTGPAPTYAGPVLYERPAAPQMVPP